VGLLEAVGCARARVDTSTFVVDRAVDLVRVVTASSCDCTMIILNNIDIVSSDFVSAADFSHDRVLFQADSTTLRTLRAPATGGRL
jgi:hypothetical protein